MARAPHCHCGSRRFKSGRSRSWPCRLTVRTPGSQPGNRGSIPRRVINIEGYNDGTANPRFAIDNGIESASS